MGTDADTDGNGRGRGTCAMKRQHVQVAVTEFNSTLNFFWEWKIVDIRVRRTHKTVAWLFFLAAA